jgi:hypothetical protein
MVFSDSVVKDAWNRSNGRCECTRQSCRHTGRCNKTFRWESRGAETELGWEAHHVNANGSDTLSNCEILCQTCHKATSSYGG